VKKMPSNAVSRASTARHIASGEGSGGPGPVAGSATEAGPGSPEPAGTAAAAGDAGEASTGSTSRLGASGSTGNWTPNRPRPAPPVGTEPAVYIPP
jgi:hypothetical protein